MRPPCNQTNDIFLITRAALVSSKKLLEARAAAHFGLYVNPLGVTFEKNGLDPYLGSNPVA